MPEPSIGKHPTEIFGYSYTDNSQPAVEARKNQYCPFLKDECKKPRKSEPEIKIGICSVGYRGRFSQDYRPIVICPHRFERNVLFDFVQQQQFNPISPEEQIAWTPEISLGTMGWVDFVGVKLQRKEEHVDIKDFVCLEVQAAGTTGSPWEAVKELATNGRFLQESYTFGINWANEFAKTMMQQAYKKGAITESWGKKLIFAIQDVGLTYLQNTYDASGLHPAQSEDSLYFYALKMAWEEEANAWVMKPHQTWGTNTEGVRKILSGLSDEDLPTQEKFVQRIYESLGIKTASNNRTKERKASYTINFLQDL